MNKIIFFIFVFVSVVAHAELNIQLRALPHSEGPNCWNGALVTVGVLKNFRFLHPNEFKYLVETNCKAVEQPFTGALGRMYDDVGEVHAFVWLSDSLVFAKHSNRSLERYKTMSMEEMLRSYAVKRECAMDPSKPNCRRLIAYYQCSAPQGDLLRQIQQLEEIEKLVYELVFSPSTRMHLKDKCDSDPYRLKSRLLEQIQQAVVDLSSKPIFDLQYFKYWIESVRMQISDSANSLSHVRCKELSWDEKYRYHTNVKNALDELLTKINQ